MDRWCGGWGASFPDHHTRQSKISTPTKTVPSFQRVSFMASTSFLSAGDTLSPDLWDLSLYPLQRLKPRLATIFLKAVVSGGNSRQALQIERVLVDVHGHGRPRASVSFRWEEGERASP